MIVTHHRSIILSTIWMDLPYPGPGNLFSSTSFTWNSYRDFLLISNFRHLTCDVYSFRIPISVCTTHILRVTLTSETKPYITSYSNWCDRPRSKTSQFRSVVNLVPNIGSSGTRCRPDVYIYQTGCLTDFWTRGLVL